MKYPLFLSIIVTMFVASRSATAQPFLLTDVSPTMAGVEVGAFFGQGRVQGGFAAGVFHSYDFNRPAPDIEAYGAIAWQPSENWFTAAFVGGGILVGETVVPSVRGLLILTQTSDTAFRTSLFVMVTPESGAVFLQPRFGPSIRLNGGHTRLFPHLALDAQISSTDQSFTLRAHPGCTFLVSW